MSRYRRLTFWVCAVLLFLGSAAQRTSANALSFTGTLPTPESTFTLVFSVTGSGAQTIDLQTWGFGGGTNAASQVISAGGFDPLVAVFSGIGPSASLINGTSDVLSNFASFMGCPPAGTVAFSNGDSVCGDINMSLVLNPGNYTLILSDAAYIPNAFFDNGTLGEGFTDFSSGVFQTCDTNSNGVTSCITPSGNYAFDITDTGNGVVNPGPTPEPGTLFLLGSGLLCLGWTARRRAFAFRAVRIR